MEFALCPSLELLAFLCCWEVVFLLFFTGGWFFGLGFLFFFFFFLAYFFLCSLWLAKVGENLAISVT